MMADLQSRLEYSLHRSYQDREENGEAYNAVLQERISHSRPPRMSSIPLLDRIQMDRDANDIVDSEVRSVERVDKPLIERLDIAPVLNDRLYRSTSTWASTNDTEGYLNWVNTEDGYRDGSSDYTRKTGVNHSQKQQNGWEASTQKQLNSRESPTKLANHNRSRSYSTSHPPEKLRDDNIVFPKRGSGHSGGATSTPRMRQSPEVAQASPSVTREAFVDYFLPLTQRIADARMEDSKDETVSSNARVSPSVITEEVLDRFGSQLINLSQELQHHKSHISSVKKTQDIAANASGSQVLPRVSLNGHHPDISERSGSHASRVVTKESPKHLVRTPTSEYRERGRRSSPSYSPTNVRLEPSRTYSSSERRRASGDFTHDYRGKRRSAGHHEHSRRDLDRPSISPRRKRSLPRRSSSPTRYRRGHSPSPPRRKRRYSPSPERRHHSERAKDDSTSRRRESLSNVQPNETGPRPLHGLLEKYNSIAPSQQGTRTVPSLDVPGLWIAFRGLQEIGMSVIQFKIDEQMALKWNLQSNGNTRPRLGGAGVSLNSQDRLKLSLELSCFSHDDFQMTMENLGGDLRSHDLVEALSTLKNTWPPQGHLIISINAESQNQKSWFPDIYKQKESIKLEEFLCEGVNHVKFIQLSDLSRNIFVLLATATTNGIKNDSTRLDFLLPIESDGLPFQKTIPTLSKA